MRYIWITFGLIALGLGALGVILPLLPTVPFLLLAAFCFARGSEKLHRWMMDHRTLGPPIKDWQEKGAINRKAKLIATASVIAVFTLSWIMNVKMTVLVIQAVTLSCVMLFIWTRPDQ